MIFLLFDVWSSSVWEMMKLVLYAGWFKMGEVGKESWALKRCGFFSLDAIAAILVLEN